MATHVPNDIRSLAKQLAARSYAGRNKAWFKQLIPCTRWSIYHNVQTNRREFCIWKQWLGKAYDVRAFSV